ncbi:MAG: hypothetical protein ACQESP_11935 [Candidatus Muiribacteriota bacterium]
MKKLLFTITITLFLFSMNLNAADNEQYTSLVIDATDLSVSRSMSPKIINESGLEIYGTVLDEGQLNKVMEMGVVAYVDSLENARKHTGERLGNNPYVVKARGVVGKSGSNIVINNDDASKILRLNRTMKFLDNFKVIILVSKRDE